MTSPPPPEGAWHASVDGEAWSRAHGDESFHEAPGDGGVYVVAASVFTPDDHDTARRAMLELRGRRRVKKVHWHQMDHRQRCRAVEAVVGLGGIHLATVGRPVAPRRQDRARACCLGSLVYELHLLGVGELLLESRTPAQNERDVEIVRSARFNLPKGAPFRVGHVPGDREPLCWAADIIAGAVRMGYEGDADFRRLLRGQVDEIEVLTDR